MGGDLGGLGDGPLKNFRWGTAHASVPLSNISRSSVIGCVRKYELSKKGVIKEFFSELDVFLWSRKVYICYVSYFKTVKTDKT